MTPDASPAAADPAPTPEVSSPSAWQPFTPPGVAAFARASLSRLLTVQLVFALFSAGCLVWFVDRNWCPVVEEFIQKLPELGEIDRGMLRSWRDGHMVRAANSFLSVAVNSGEADASDFQVVFSEQELHFRSLLGWRWQPYPAGWKMPFNKIELWPWWGAWKPAILAGIFALAVPALMLTWAVLALVYAPLVRLIAFMSNRDSAWPQNWRLASAALLPGALVMSFGLILYGVGAINFVKLLLVCAFHFVVGWVYLFFSPVFLPRDEAAPAAVAANPFGSGATGAAPPGKNPLGAAAKKSNPFK